MKEIIFNLFGLTGKSTGEIIAYSVVAFHVTLFVIIILLSIRSFFKRRSRSKALRKTAEDLGFTFAANKCDPVLKYDIEESGLGFGHSRKIKNIIKDIRMKDAEMSVFDYKNIVGDKTRFFLTCALAKFDVYTDFPEFNITPLSFTGKLNYMLFGATGGDLEEDFPELSKKYDIYCFEEEEIDDVVRLIDPSVEADIEAKKNISIFVYGRYVAYCINEYIKPEDLPAFISDAQNTIQLLYYSLKNLKNQKH